MSGTGFQTTTAFTGDITIGAVEIKDGVSDTRASVVPLFGGLNGLVVSTTAGVLPVTNIFDKVLAIPTGIETTIVSYLVPAGKIFLFLGAQGTGSADGDWLVYFDADPQMPYGTSWTDRTAKFPVNQEAIPLTAGQLISVKVIHNEAAVQDFWGNLYGVLYTA